MDWHPICAISAALLFFHGTPAGASELPDLGPAAPFSLTAQDGRRFDLSAMKGKVVVLSFTYTHCQDICPTSTAKMVRMQNALGTDFGRRVHFLTVTLDPARDKPLALREYARRFGASLAGWHFLTGTSAEVGRVAHDYGVAFRKKAGRVEHNALTTLLDGQGRRRIQYIGSGFDAAEMLADIRALIAEGPAE